MLTHSNKLESKNGQINLPETLLKAAYSVVILCSCEVKALLVNVHSCKLIFI